MHSNKIETRKSHSPGSESDWHNPVHPHHQWSSALFLPFIYQQQGERKNCFYILTNKTPLRAQIIERKGRTTLLADAWVSFPFLRPANTSRAATTAVKLRLGVGARPGESTELVGPIPFQKPAPSTELKRRKRVLITDYEHGLLSYYPLS